MRLAGHLGKSIREVEQFDAHELREWLAFHRFVAPFGDEWRQTARTIVATLAPYSSGRALREEDYMPIEKPPMTGAEIAAELAKLKR
ncbi:MAG: hypothetical protein EBR82_45975 [Caulobacteraceae bacterium]|nr:hypothetical protein [Caulobacteraceae bacterium]